MKKILLTSLFTLFLSSCTNSTKLINRVTSGPLIAPKDKINLLKNISNNYSDGNKTGYEYLNELDGLIKKSQSIGASSNLVSDINTKIVYCYEDSLFESDREKQCVLNVYIENINKLRHDLKWSQAIKKRDEDEYRDKEKRLSDYLKTINVKKLEPNKNNLFLFCEYSARSVASIAATPFSSGVRIATRHDEMKYLLMDDNIVWEIKKAVGDDDDYMSNYQYYLRECEIKPSKHIINYSKIFK